MLGLKLYLYNSTVEVVSTFNRVILKHELCVLLTETCIVKSFLQNNNNDEKKLFLMF